MNKPFIFLLIVSYLTSIMGQDSPFKIKAQITNYKEISNITGLSNKIYRSKKGIENIKIALIDSDGANFFSGWVNGLRDNGTTISGPIPIDFSTPPLFTYTKIKNKNGDNGKEFFEKNEVPLKYSDWFNEKIFVVPQYPQEFIRKHDGDFSIYPEENKKELGLNDGLHVVQILKILLDFTSLNPYATSEKEIKKYPQIYVLNGRGDINFMRGVTYAAEELKVDVIVTSVSFPTGHSQGKSLISNVVDRAVKNGVIFISSAGNLNLYSYSSGVSFAPCEDEENPEEDVLRFPIYTRSEEIEKITHSSQFFLNNLSDEETHILQTHSLETKKVCSSQLSFRNNLPNNTFTIYLSWYKKNEGHSFYGTDKDLNLSIYDANGNDVTPNSSKTGRKEGHLEQVSNSSSNPKLPQPGSNQTLERLERIGPITLQEGDYFLRISSPNPDAFRAHRRSSYREKNPDIFRIFFQPSGSRPPLIFDKKSGKSFEIPSIFFYNSNPYRTILPPGDSHLAITVGDTSQTTSFDLDVLRDASKPTFILQTVDFIINKQKILDPGNSFMTPLGAAQIVALLTALQEKNIRLNQQKFNTFLRLLNEEKNNDMKSAILKENAILSQQLQQRMNNGGLIEEEGGVGAGGGGLLGMDGQIICPDFFVAFPPFFYFYSNFGMPLCFPYGLNGMNGGAAQAFGAQGVDINNQQGGGMTVNQEGQINANGANGANGQQVNYQNQLKNLAIPAAHIQKEVEEYRNKLIENKLFVLPNKKTFNRLIEELEE